MPTIVEDFIANAKFSDGEVNLFRKLASSISSQAKTTFISETHGTICNVEFTSIQGNIQCCEIADLLIVTLNKKRKRAKATFLQAKKENESQWVTKAIDRDLSNGCFDFSCQYDQWELLSFRPLINGVKKFNPPQKLLSSMTPNISSYGVFFENTHGLLDLKYSIAEFITSTTLPESESGKKYKNNLRMSINDKYEKYYLNGSKIVCRNLDEFIESLLSFQIGDLLKTQEGSWILQYAQRRYSGSGNVAGAEDAIDFSGYLSSVPPDDLGDFEIGREPGGPAMLIVEVEGESLFPF